MSEETDVLDEVKSLDQPVEPLSWFQTWKLALTRPSVNTYETIARDPNATSRRAYRWIFIANFVGDVLSISLEFITLFLRKQEPFQLFSANTGGFYSENVSKITG